jgi:hypothetical protein
MVKNEAGNPTLFRVAMAFVSTTSQKLTLRPADQRLDAEPRHATAGDVVVSTSTPVRSSCSCARPDHNPSSSPILTSPRYPASPREKARRETSPLRGCAVAYWLGACDAYRCVGCDVVCPHDRQRHQRSDADVRRSALACAHELDATSPAGIRWSRIAYMALPAQAMVTLFDNSYH